MKISLLISLCFITVTSFSQNLVKGKVIDPTDQMLPGAKIEEVGTSNSTRSDFDGLFEIKTSSDSSSITFSHIGYDSQTILIESDTTLTVRLLEYSYDARWLTLGGNFEFFNSVAGFQISNGLDEIPLIHFEDFQDNLLFKVFGQTNFSNNYKYGFDFGLYWLKFIGRTTLSFSSSNFMDSEIRQTDINLTSLIGYLGNTGLLFRTGYQHLNGMDNLGIGAGIEQNGKGFYLGLNSRYYFDYFHHQAYLQFKICRKQFLSGRINYDLIDTKSLLSVGVNYSFKINHYRQ